MLKLVLLLLLHDHLVLVELIDCITVDVLEKVRRLIDDLLLLVGGELVTRVGWLFLYPKALWRFEVIPEDRNNFLDLVI